MTSLSGYAWYPKFAPNLSPEGKNRIEWCDSELPGLYVLVSATSPGQGTYMLRFKDDRAKTCHQKVGRTTDINLSDARKEAKKLKAEIALGGNPRAEAKARKAIPTLTTFFTDEYTPHIRVHKRSWKRDLELFSRIQPKFGHLQLNQITRQGVQQFHTSLLETGLAPATCDHHLKLLKHVFNLAIDWGHDLEKNPVARVPLFRVDNRIERYLSEDELERLLTVLNTDENRTVCLIALFLLSTGARLNEALSATWAQIDRHNRVWRILAANSKSKRMRSVPLNDTALEVLRQLETQGKFAYLFINPKTGRPYVSFTKAWSRIREKAQLSNLRCHDLRHSYASMLVNSGRSLYEVQQILGHSDPSVTTRYAHISSKSLQDAANSASAIITGASKKAA